MLKHLRIATPIFFGFLLLFLGIFVSERMGLYTRYDGIDKIWHLAGGVVAAWFVLSLLQSDITHLAGWKQAFIFIGCTTLIGVVWEWAEYISGFARTAWPWGYHYFHGGNLADTVGDLLADVAGGALLASWALYKERV